MKKFFDYILAHQNNLTNFLSVITTIATIVATVNTILQSTGDFYRTITGGALSILLYVHHNPHTN